MIESDGYLLPTGTTVEEQNRQARVAVLPIGSFEQHGPALPLITDTVIAVTIAREVSAGHPVLHLPPVTISCSHEHAAWAGTVSISAATLYAIVRDIAESLRRSGIGSLALVNGHGGNYVLANVVQEAGPAGHVMALFPTEADWAAARAAAGIRTHPDSDMHAGELETSLLLYAHPRLVHPDYAGHDHLTGNRDHMLTRGLAGYTESGVAGRPSLASAEKGRLALASLVASFTALLTVLGSPSTPSTPSN